MDVDFLRAAYSQLNEKGAPGLNKVTAADYAEHLEENFADLHQRLCSGSYKAPPIKRVWIDKDNGKKRPLGIPEFEDKIVQRAVEMRLSAIYEEMFHDFSHGFRKVVERRRDGRRPTGIPGQGNATRRCDLTPAQQHLPPLGPR